MFRPESCCFPLLVLASLLACKGQGSSGQTSSEPGQLKPSTPSEESATERKAKQEAEHAKRELARIKAPPQVSVSSLGCACGPAKTIVVTCQISSSADVPVTVEVGATAKTGVIGTKSSGQGKVHLPARGSKTVKVATSYAGLVSCSSAGACECSKRKVTPAG